MKEQKTRYETDSRVNDTISEGGPKNPCLMAYLYGFGIRLGLDSDIAIYTSEKRAPIQEYYFLCGGWLELQVV